VILTQPFTPGVIQDAIDQTIFFDLGIQNIIQLLQPSMAAFRYLHGTNDNDPLLDNIISAAPFSIDGTECCCVVDSGFSFTHVVPTINTKVVVGKILFAFCA
jgi:actin-related protein